MFFPSFSKLFFSGKLIYFLDSPGFPDMKSRHNTILFSFIRFSRHFKTPGKPAKYLNLFFQITGFSSLDFPDPAAVIWIYSPTLFSLDFQTDILWSGFPNTRHSLWFGFPDSTALVRLSRPIYSGLDIQIDSPFFGLDFQT